MRIPADKLNLGCAAFVLPGWINIDYSANAWLAKHKVIRGLFKLFHLAPKELFEITWPHDVLIRDLRKPLTFADNSISAIYSSCLWEHLYLEQGKQLLKECFRVLKPGGILRVVVPNLEVIVLKYVNAENTENLSSGKDIKTKADALNYDLGMYDAEPFSGNIFYRIYALLTELHLHKWWYDPDSLSMYFKNAGFMDIQNKQSKESRIEGMASLEANFGKDHFCIEGIKPRTLS